MKKIVFLSALVFALTACSSTEAKKGTETVVGGTGEVVSGAVIGASQIIQDTGKAISNM